MHRRFRPLAAVIGALALVGPHTPGVAAAVVPDDIQIDIAVDELDGRHLMGTVACAPLASIDLDASISQEGDPLPVSAKGDTDAFECGPDPVPFRIELGGDDVLVPGTVTYEVRAFPWYPAVGGELTLTDEVDLGPAPPADFGPFPIHIDPEAGVSAAAPLVTGTIRCDEPEELMFLNVDGWQMAGRYRLEFHEFAHVPCDGETPFAIPITSDRGGLVPGPATVTVTGPWGATPDRYSRKTMEVELRSATTEPDFRPEPQPGTGIRFGRVLRVDGHLVTSVYTAPCTRGSEEVWISADIRPADFRTDDRWWNPGAFARSGGGSERVCTGAEQAHLLIVPDGFTEEEEVVVEVERYVFHTDPENTDVLENTVNAATFTVVTK